MKRLVFAFATTLSLIITFGGLTAYATTYTVTSFATVGKEPLYIAFDSSGNLYSTNYDANSVSEVSPAGVVLTTFITGFNVPRPLAFDSSGNLYVGNEPAGNAGTITKITPSGTITTFASGVGYPFDLKFDSSGNLYTPDEGSNTVLEITPSGVVSTYATVGGAPYSIAFDPSGNLYVGTYAAAGYKVTPAGVVTTFASGFSTDDFIFDTSGNTSCANDSTNTIMKITPSGVVTTYATVGSRPFQLLFGGSGDLYVSNSSSNSVSVITPSGSVSTITGGFSLPSGMAMDSSGNLYVANEGNSIISKINTNDPIVPTCTVSLSPDPSPYSSTGTPVTLAWSSSNATQVYINNVGWVGTSGSTHIAAQANTDYSCYAYNASANTTGSWQTYSLTVLARLPYGDDQRVIHLDHYRTIHVHYGGFCGRFGNVFDREYVRNCRHRPPRTRIRLFRQFVCRQLRQRYRIQSYSERHCFHVRDRGI